MRPDKFTQKRQEALQAAQDLASQHNHAEIGNEHFLTALLDQREGVTRPLLEKVGVTAKGLRDRLEQGLDRLPTDSFGRAGVELRRIAKRRPWRDVRHLRVRNVAEVPRSPCDLGLFERVPPAKTRKAREMFVGCDPLAAVLDGKRGVICVGDHAAANAPLNAEVGKDLPMTGTWCKDNTQWLGLEKP